MRGLLDDLELVIHRTSILMGIGGIGMGTGLARKVRQEGGTPHFL